MMTAEKPTVSIDSSGHHMAGRSGPFDAAVEYVRYRLPRDRTDAFVDAYRAAVVPLAVSEYCLGYDLTQCAEEPELFILRIRWTSIDDHLQNFRGSEQFREFFSYIGPFVDQIEEMRHYTTILTG